MAFIKQIPVDQAEGELQQVYDAATRRAGGIANIIRVMSRDGRSASASMGLYVSIMKSDNALTAAQREMLAAVVSNVNDCFY